MHWSRRFGQDKPAAGHCWLLGAALACCGAAPALAAPGNTVKVSGTSTVTIYQPIVLAHYPGQTLNFGRIALNGAGTVTVTPASASSTTGGAALVTGATPAADWFYVTADPNRAFNITSTSGTITNGGATLGFTTTPAVGSYQIPAGYTLYFAVGGTLSLPAGTPGGTYTGSYVVTVAYQ